MFNKILILFLSFLVSCDIYQPIHRICWQDVQGKTFSIIEYISDFQDCETNLTFGQDTIWLKRVYFNPVPETTWVIHSKDSVVQEIVAITPYADGHFDTLWHGFTRSFPIDTQIVAVQLKIDWIRYMKGPVLSKSYEQSDSGEILRYVWKRKGYADENYEIQEIDNSVMDVWYLRTIEDKNLIMGTLNPLNEWTLKEK
jgi:hypothetical protein